MLLNKVAIITGSSSGIGTGIALKFAAEGVAGLILHGRDAEALGKVRQQCVAAGTQESKVQNVLGDLAEEETRQRLVKTCVDHFGRIDILVNNAGMPGVGGLQNAKMEEFDRLFHVNVKAPVALAQLCLPHLIKTKGNIVNVSSIGGIKPIDGYLLYSMTKAAIDHFTRCTALELGPLQVRVNSVNPGYVPTKLVERAGGELDAANARMAAFHALRRNGTPEEIAEAVAWLASDKASFTTGHCLLVDGGIGINTVVNVNTTP